jgi:diaminohydroxyphosphoribosylaminopyrimidine deaminase/5-amino-6-(5-phosphoribosylamino)uracil reductase
MSVIVEGGKSVLEYFIRETLWDEARVFVGKKKFERGLKAPVICQEPDSISHVSDDLLHVYRNRIK